MSLQYESIKPIIDWLQLNPMWAAFVVGLISCAESLAIIGLFIPGTIVMPAIGSMVGAGILPAYSIFLAAILGAIIGDNVSYWLGYHYHNQIRNYWPFNRFPKLLNNGIYFFKKYGGLSVFIGRFVGPVRPIIPVIAGILNMSPVSFFLANITSAVAWAVLYMAPGLLLGALSTQLAPHVAPRLLLILFVLLLGVWFITWSVNKLWNLTHHGLEALGQKIWIRAGEIFPRTTDFFMHQHIKNSKPLSIMLYLLFWSILLSILSYVVKKHGVIAHLDWPLFLFLRSIEIPPLDNIMLVLYYLSSTLTLTCVSLILVLALVWQKAWRTLGYWLINFSLTLLLIKSLQFFISMVPPEQHLTFISGGIYPYLSIGWCSVLIGNFFIASYYSNFLARYKKILLLSIFFFLLSATLPLIYFGLTWFSSCLAAVICAAITTWICILFFHRKESALNLKPLISFGVLVLITSVVTASWEGQKLLGQLEKPQFQNTFNFKKWWNNTSPLPVMAYRKNILDQPEEVFTLQYAGNLNTLRHILEKQGWKVVPKANLVLILNRIAAKDRAQELPLFPDLYQAQKPILIMTKILLPQNQLVIVRWWSSNILLEPHHVPLWFGTINYRKKHYHEDLTNMAEENSAILFLVTEFKKEMISYPSQIIMPDFFGCDMFCGQPVLKIMNVKLNKYEQ